MQQTYSHSQNKNRKITFPSGNAMAFIQEINFSIGQ